MFIICNYKSNIALLEGISLAFLHITFTILQSFQVGVDILTLRVSLTWRSAIT